MNKATIILNGFLAAAFVLAIYIPASTHEAPELWPSDNPAQAWRVQEQRDAMPKNVPAWKSSDSRFGCTPKATEEIHFNVLVVTQMNDREVMSSDEAWERGKNDNRADDIWVIGFC